MNAAWTLLAFGFLATGLWWLWLLAAGIPLLLHLWNRRQRREMPWAAMHWLLAAVKKNARRMRLEQWLLLAVRTLLIVCLIVALAQPYLETPGLLFVSGQRTHHLLVVDGSYSMGAKPVDRSLFQAAKERALAVVDASGSGDAFTLVVLGDPPRAEIQRPSGYKDEVRRVIEGLELPHAGGDLRGTLAVVRQILDAAPTDDPGLEQTVVYFFTDLDRACWTPHRADETAAAEELRKECDRLARRVSLVRVSDLSAGAGDNLAVTDVAPRESLLTAGRKVKFTAAVRNYGRQVRASETLGWYLDGRRQGTSVVESLPPGGRAEAADFVVQIDDPGEHWVEARLESAAGDPLEIDNRRYFAFEAPRELNVLLVNGKTSAERFGGATDYLALAVAPGERVPNRVRVAATVIPDGDLVEQDLSRFHAVFFSNVGQFSGSEARLIDAFLRQGGGCVFFLGDQVQAESYNRHLAGDAGLRVLPARLGEAVGETRYRFLPGEYAHPVIREFKGQEQAGLLSTPVYRYVRLELPAAGGSRRVLDFDSGDPAIVESEVGRGRVLLVATAASTASVDAAGNPWTPLAQSPVFVPIVQGLLSRAVSGQMESRNQVAGEPLSGATSGDEAVSVAAPGERPRPAQREPGRWEYSETGRSGVYVAQRGPGKDQTFALNYAIDVDAAYPESRLERLSAQELRDEVTPYFSLDAAGAGLVAAASGELRRQGGLHKWFLYAALGLALCDTFLAWRLGRRAA